VKKSFEQIYLFVYINLLILKFTTLTAPSTSYFHKNKLLVCKEKNMNETSVWWEGQMYKIRYRGEQVSGGRCVFYEEKKLSGVFAKGLKWILIPERQTAKLRDVAKSRGLIFIFQLSSPLPGACKKRTHRKSVK